MKYFLEIIWGISIFLENENDSLYMDFIIIFFYIYKSENHLISQKIGFFFL